MTKQSRIDPDFQARLLDAGGKAMDAAARCAEINLNALKAISDSQLEIGAALVGYGGEQFRALGEVADPKIFLQRQKEAADALRERLEVGARALQDVAVQSQKAYADLAASLG